MYPFLAGYLVQQCVRLENGCSAASEKMWLAVR